MHLVPYTPSQNPLAGEISVETRYIARIEGVTTSGEEWTPLRLQSMINCL